LRNPSLCSEQRFGLRLTHKWWLESSIKTLRFLGA
jgi:hypothetical protein